MSDYEPFRPVLATTNVPAEFAHVTWDDYDIERGDPDKLKQLQEWEPTLSKPNIFLCGEPGVGKTMLAVATMHEIQRRHYHTSKLHGEALVWARQFHYSGYFISLNKFVDLNRSLLSASVEHRKNDAPAEQLNEIRNLVSDITWKVKVLVVDDVGKEYHTDSGYAVERFDQLMRDRHHAGLPTIFTTNVAALNKFRFTKAGYTSSMQNFLQRTSLVLDFFE